MRMRRVKSRLKRWPTILCSALRPRWSGHKVNLMIRDCYKQMWDFANSSTRFPLLRKLALLGNSGIGKSGMLVYLASRFLAEGKQVCFIFREVDTSTRRTMLWMDPSSKQELGPGHFTYTASEGDFVEELKNNEDAFVLVDGYAPNLMIRGTCILACSPDSSNHHEWSKNAAILYMPPWSEMEIFTANEAIYKVDFDEIWRRYTVVGASRCWFFEEASFIQKGVRSFLSSPFVSHEVCDRVCCINPAVNSDDTINYKNYTYDYNSQHILKEVHVSMSEQRKKLRKCLMPSTSFSLLTLKVKDAEFAVHELLFQGVTFPCNVFRATTAGSASEPGVITFPEQLPVAYNPRSAELEEGMYYLPTTANQAVWDAFFISSGKLYFVKVTPSRLRTRKIIHPQTVMKKAGVSTAVLMFVPPLAHKCFQFRGWNDKRGNPDGLPHDEVEQWAVESLEIDECDLY